MIKTQIGNPDLESAFDDDSFTKRSGGSKAEYDDLCRLYESTLVPMPKNGDIVNAVFQGKSAEYFIFSIYGLKDDIRIDDKVSEYKYLKNTQKGDKIDLVVTNINHDNFFIKGSISSLYESMAHTNLKSLEEGGSVKAFVKSLNPAGYDIDLLHGGVVLPAFMPNTLAGINKLYDPNSIIGDTFDVMIESYAEKEGTYIVSRRKYLQSLIPTAIKELTYDESYTGHVTGTTPFGVFVEFNGCLTGMIHKANINPEWQDKLSEIKPGFEIVFYVKEIIKGNKIILTQIIRETLWDTIIDGQIIEGVIKDVKQFGTLVNLDEETVGLIHTSEMVKLKRKFTSGDKVNVKVLAVDRSSRKIFLTLS